MSDGLNYENRIAVGFLLVNFPSSFFIHSRHDVYHPENCHVCSCSRQLS
uniref:Uncharacterized protein n=1 Tax=Arundo donax TaxID=35708 RepID=A0A0A9FNP7_ARUDO